MDGRPCGELVVEPFAVCDAQADTAVRCRAAQFFSFAGDVFAVDVSRDGMEKDIVMDADPVLRAHPLRSIVERCPARVGRIPACYKIAGWRSVVHPCTGDHRVNSLAV